MEYEGMKGTVVCTTNQYVWVTLDKDPANQLKKKKHNVKRI
jgi:hypothetical protein